MSALPALSVPSAQEDAPPGGAPPRTARVPHLSQARPPESEREAAPTVLIAEDHDDSRDALGTLLDAFGYRVVFATNGAEAVERALAALPNLILMDMMMPRVDGFAATRALRADARFEAVPIIAITAMEGARGDVLAAGCDDVVVKPIDVRAFLEKVREWLRTGRAAAAG